MHLPRGLRQSLLGGLLLFSVTGGGAYALHRLTTHLQTLNDSVSMLHHTLLLMHVQQTKVTLRGLDCLQYGTSPYVVTDPPMLVLPAQKGE